MNNVKLTKFPVTAPDGTEYRVTIRERDDGMWVNYFADVRVYVKRKHLGYRLVYRTTFNDGDGVYYESMPNFIRIAAEAVKTYYDYLEACENRRKRLEKQAQGRASALRRFAEWDGRIAE